MDMTGEQVIAVPQADVWRGLNDPEILKACIPGCESIERITATDYRVALTASVGPVKAKFAGKLTLGDINPPTSYSLVFEGAGGSVGFAKGNAHVSLSPDGSATKLTYSAKAMVGGSLAQIGSRLIDSVAMKMAEEFFAKFNEQMAPASAEPVRPAATSHVNLYWVVGVILAVVAILVLWAVK